MGQPQREGRRRPAAAGRRRWPPSTELGGNFAFDSTFTSQNGVGGHEIASLLLGLPVDRIGAGQSRARSSGSRSTGVRYVQDDWRVNAKFTLNYGLRFEHEDGLREIDNRQTVAFDQSVTNPIDGLVPKDGHAARRQDLEGGLIYAGVNGAPGLPGRSEKDQARAACRRDLRDRHQTRSSAAATGSSGRRGTTSRTPASSARTDSRGRRRSVQSPPESDVPTRSAGQPVSRRTAAADRELARPLDERRRAHRLHRSDEGFAQGAPVLGRHAARARWPDGDHDRLRRRHRARHRLRRNRRRDHQHQPDRSGRRAPDVPDGRRRLGCGEATRARAESVLRHCGGGRARVDCADSSGSAAATVPAVRRHQRAPDDDAGRSGNTTPCPSSSTSGSARSRWGGRFSYTLS